MKSTSSVRGTNLNVGSLGVGGKLHRSLVGVGSSVKVSCHSQTWACLGSVWAELLLNLFNYYGQYPSVACFQGIGSDSRTNTPLHIFLEAFVVYAPATSLSSLSIAVQWRNRSVGRCQATVLVLYQPASGTPRFLDD